MATGNYKQRGNTMVIMPRDVIKEIRRLFPEIPEFAQSITIRLDVDSVVKVECTFLPTKTGAKGEIDERSISGTDTGPA